MALLILIPKEIYNTCYFLGGPVLLTPPLYGFIIQNHENRSETIDTPPNTRLFNKGCELTSLMVLMLCSKQNSSSTKGINFLIMQNKIQVQQRALTS